MGACPDSSSPTTTGSTAKGFASSPARCAALATQLTRHVLEQPRNPEIILNVNFPVEEFQGVKVTRLGKRVYSEGVIERLDPRGRKYYWIGGDPPTWHPGEGTDFEAV